MDNPELRKYLCGVVNNEDNVGDRQKLEGKYGKVWDTQELQRDFTVHQFAAPFVIATRKADGQTGSLTFQHQPRFYFDFVPAGAGEKV